MPSAAGSRTFVPCRRPQRSPMAPGRRRPPGRPGRCRLTTQSHHPRRPAGDLRRGQRRHRAVRRSPRNAEVRHAAEHQAEGRHAGGDGGGPARNRHGGSSDRFRRRAPRFRSPIARSTTASIRDKSGNGIIGLGRIRMHGAIKSPTFARLTGDARAAQTKLVLERPVGGMGGRRSDRRPGYAATARGRARARLQVRATSRSRSRPSTAPDDHCPSGAGLGSPGAVESDGRTLLRPHVGNLSRNVSVASERGAARADT